MLLDAFARVSLPNLLVASKCDAPLNRRQIDPSAIEHLGPFGGVETMQTSSNSSSQKKCMATILNIIIARRNGRLRNSYFLVYLSYYIHIRVIFTFLLFYSPFVARSQLSILFRPYDDAPNLPTPQPIGWLYAGSLCCQVGAIFSSSHGSHISRVTLINPPSPPIPLPSSFLS